MTEVRDSLNCTQEESDSGDSLFITQKPVPEAVRKKPRKRRHCSVRSIPTAPRDLEESDDDILCPAYDGKSTTQKKWTIKKFRPPRYSFPFLKGRKWKPRNTLLTVQRNTKLHNVLMGGFFKCVTELWQGCERTHDLESSLPTLDMDGEYISPLSEEEEERSVDEDMKVVEKKLFVAPSKAKCSQPWETPTKRDSQIKQQRSRRRRTASQEITQESQRKMLHKISAKASISRVTLFSTDADTFDDGDPPCGLLAEKETNDKHASSDTGIFTQTKTPRTKRYLARVNKKILLHMKDREVEPCNNSNATICESPKQQGSPLEQTLRGSEADITATEAQAVFHTDDLSQAEQEEDEPESQSLLQGLPELVSDTNNESVCKETRVKKKKKAKGDHVTIEARKDQSQEEEEGVHAAASVNMEAKEIHSPPEDNRAEAPTLHDDSILRQEERDIPNSTQMKKKKKKNMSVAENVRQEVDGNLECGARLEDSGFSVMCNMENTNKENKKKKRMKTSVESVESVEQLQYSAIPAQPLNENTEMQREQKQREKEKRLEVGEECEGGGNYLLSQEALECSHEKKRPNLKNKQQSSSVEDGQDMSLFNDVNLKGHTGLSVKKKKKKKKRVSICEGVDIHYTPDKSKKVENADNSEKTVDGADDQDTEQVTKKKKKKREKIGEICSRNVSNDIVAQSSDPVSARKKKKKKTSSFLDADSEQTNAQSHQQQSSSSPSVAAHVWCAENPCDSTWGDVETESAEIDGNSSGGVRKKKKQSKISTTQENVEEDHKPEFEEPNRTCQTAFSDNTGTGVKRKKKRKRTESGSVTTMERSDSRADEGHTPADEAVVLKKKKKKKGKKELH